MKKIKLIIAAAAMLSLVSSSAVYADGFAPGEGLYVGAFVGASTGIVQPKVSTVGSGQSEAGVFEATEGGLGLFGIQGGGWVGYGYKMGDLYLGWDMDFAGSGEEFKLTSSISVETATDDDNVTEISAQRNWRGGGAGRIGYYINADTLLSFKGGITASEFDINTGHNTGSVYAGGYQLGVGLESRLSAVDPNLSVRLEGVFDDYFTAPVSGIDPHQGTGTREGHDSEVTGSALAARVGLQYSFFDANTLF
jgi:hypothetical protein